MTPECAPEFRWNRLLVPELYLSVCLSVCTVNSLELTDLGDRSQILCVYSLGLKDKMINFWAPRVKGQGHGKGRKHIFGHISGLR